MVHHPYFSSPSSSLQVGINTRTMRSLSETEAGMRRRNMMDIDAQPPSIDSSTSTTRRSSPDFGHALHFKHSDSAIFLPPPTKWLLTPKVGPRGFFFGKLSSPPALQSGSPRSPPISLNQTYQYFKKKKVPAFLAICLSLSLHFLSISIRLWVSVSGQIVPLIPLRFFTVLLAALFAHVAWELGISLEPLNRASTVHTFKSQKGRLAEWRRNIAELALRFYT